MTDELAKVNKQAPSLLTTKEASAALRISQSKLYGLIRDGSLDTVKVGRRRLVPADALTKLIDKLRKETF